MYRLLHPAQKSHVTLHMNVFLRAGTWENMGHMIIHNKFFAENNLQVSSTELTNIRLNALTSPKPFFQT